jgi:hypothetical protein
VVFDRAVMTITQVGGTPAPGTSGAAGSSTRSHPNWWRA